MHTVRLSDITDKLENVSKTRNGYTASCPAHEDSSPSFSVWAVEHDGQPKLCLHCFAGCSIEETTAALGITTADLYRLEIDTPGVKAEKQSKQRTALDLTAEELAEANEYVASGTPGPNVDRMLSRVGLSNAWEWRLGQAEDGAVIVPAFDIDGIIRGARRRYFRDSGKELSLSGSGWLPYTYRRNPHAVHPELVVTEGPIDAMTAYAAGYDVFGIFGVDNARSLDVTRDLAEAARDRVVVVVGDNDDAGRRFNVDVAKVTPVRVVVPPVPDGDLNDWYLDSPESFCAAFRAAIDSEDAEDTGKLLEDVSAFLRRFLFLGRDEWFDVLALWVLSSALTRHTEYADIAPRVGFLSGTPGSGKTLAIDLLARLSSGELVTDATPAAVVRLMNGKHDDTVPTPVPVYLDEIDNLYRSKSTDNGSLTAVLNSGYKRGATVTKADREDQEKVKQEACFGPVGFAGLAMSALPDALLTRSFIIDMPKATSAELPETFRPRRHGAEAQALADRVQAWAALSTHRVADALDESEDRLAGRIGNRELEIWSAVDAVAVIAGDGWPERVDRAIPALKDSGKEREEQPSLRLLRAVREMRDADDRPGVYAPVSDTTVSRDAICEYLNEAEPLFASYSYGRGINGETVRKMLSDFGIAAPKPHKMSGKLARGWRWEDFAEAWDRYL